MFAAMQGKNRWVNINLRSTVLKIPQCIAADIFEIKLPYLTKLLHIWPFLGHMPWIPFVVSSIRDEICWYEWQAVAR